MALNNSTNMAKPKDPSNLFPTNNSSASAVTVKLIAVQCQHIWDGQEGRPTDAKLVFCKASSVTELTHTPQKKSDAGARAWVHGQPSGRGKTSLTPISDDASLIYNFMHHCKCPIAIS